MPMQGSVGYSNNTPYKYTHFDLLLQVHLRIVAGILSRQSWANRHYWYFDLNAGSGQYADETGVIQIGSPLRALLLAHRLSHSVRAVLCEKDGDAVSRLLDALQRYGFHADPKEPLTVMSTDDRICAVVAPGDHRQSVPALLPQIARIHGRLASFYGLIYSDENGALPPFELLALLAQTLPLCDIVLHVAATPIKRQYYSPRHPLLQRLDELMEQIDKRCWLVREPYGQHQWTFLIGTNWQSFPAFNREGFWHVRSREGESILRRLSYRRKDIDEQGDLFIH